MFIPNAAVVALLISKRYTAVEDVVGILPAVVALLISKRYTLGVCRDTLLEAVVALLISKRYTSSRSFRGGNPAVSEWPLGILRGGYL
jgi:hypothetical protein